MLCFDKMSARSLCHDLAVVYIEVLREIGNGLNQWQKAWSLLASVETILTLAEATDRNQITSRQRTPHMIGHVMSRVLPEEINRPISQIP